MTCRKCAREIEDASIFCRYCGASVQAPSSPRRLTRRPAEATFGGVCAGLAAYFEVDVTFVRVTWIVLSIWPGAIVLGVVAYLAAWVLIPAANVVDTPAVAGERKQLLRSRTDRRIGPLRHPGIGPCGRNVQYVRSEP